MAAAATIPDFFIDPPFLPGEVDSYRLQQSMPLEMKIWLRPQKQVVGASPGSGSWMSGTRFYLLSLDGRVYRGYGLPKALG